jgi:predicted anti-sigma-YlaC factor YlaD
MNCRELEPRLTAYLAGELDEVSARAARGHLRVCTACRTQAEDHARLREALGALGADRPEPPAAMWDAIQRRLGEAEIADGRQSRWARWWLRARPHVLPGGLALAACAAAAVIIQVRQRGDDGALFAAARERVVHAADGASPPNVDDGADHAAAADADRSTAPRVRPDRDATVELAEETQRLEQEFRSTAAELLPLARAEVAGWRPRQARAFAVELARREGATVRAPAGRDRERAWHQLITFLETTALGERVAVAP